MVYFGLGWPISGQVIRLLLLFGAFIESEAVCSPSTCQNGGTCTDFPGDDFLCLCNKGWMGDRCQMDACISMKHVVELGVFFDMDASKYVAVEVTSLADCESRCASKYCDYHAGSNQCRQLGTSDADVVSSFTKIRQDGCAILLLCLDCFDYAPDPVWSPTDNTALCWRDDTHMAATLTCNPGNIWDDISRSTKVTKCLCGDDNWEPNDLGGCIVGVEIHPETTTEITEPETTTEITEPETTTEITEPETTTELTEPETTTEITEPETTTELTEPETTTEITEPETTTEITEPGITTDITEPGITTDITEPETSTEITKPETTTEITEPGITTELTEPETTTEITKPETTTEITEPGTTTELTEPETTTETTKPETTTELTESETTTETPKPETTTEITEPGITTELTEPETTTEITEPETTTELTEPETTTEITEPETTTELTETTTEITEPETTTEITEPGITISLISTSMSMATTENQFDPTTDTGQITVTNEPQKIPGPCPDPPFPPNMDAWYSRLVLGALEVYYRCHPSYTFPSYYFKDEYMIVCSNATWVGLPLPDCIYVGCSDISIDHASVNVPAILSEKIVEVTCQPGFQFPDGSVSRSLTCVTGGTWNSDITTCQEIQCPNLVDKGVMMSPQRNTQNSIIAAKCPAGRVLTNGRTGHPIECSKRGLWNEELYCTDTQCPPAPYLEHATVNKTDTVLVYTCQLGYMFANGNPSIKVPCTDAINVIGRLPYTCLDITCPMAPVVGNSTQNTTIAIYGTHLKFDCDYGYWFPDKTLSKIIICESNGQWSENYVHDCVVTLCDSLSDFVNATVTTHHRTVGSVVELSCTDDRLRFVDGTQHKTVMCQVDGSWDDELVSDCSDNRCSVIPKVAFCSVDTRIAVFETVVTFTCLYGYEFQDGRHNVSITCDRTTQNWNTSVSDCQTITCENAPAIMHATPSNETAVLDTTINITCQEGFLLPNGQESVSARCLVDKSWDISANYSHCIAVFCPQVEQTRHRTTSPGFRRYGTVLHIACIPGFEFTNTSDSEMFVRCQQSGHWNTTLLPCRKKQCPPVPTWLGVTSDISTNTWQFGDTLNYSCAENFRFEDDQTYKTSFCTLDGLWKPPLVQCTEMSNKFQEELPVTEAPSAEHFLVVALSLIAVTMVTIIGLDLISLKTELQRLLHNVFGDSDTSALKTTGVQDSTTSTADAARNAAKARRKQSQVKSWKTAVSVHPPLDLIREMPVISTQPEIPLEDLISEDGLSFSGSELTQDQASSSRSLSAISVEDMRDASPSSVME